MKLTIQNIFSIFSAITNNTSVVYFGVGTSMKYYIKEEPNMEMKTDGYTLTINSMNDQQDPFFLNKFSGNKVVILIDPLLEDTLKIQEKYNLNIIHTSENFRHLEGNNYTVFALNMMIEYDNDDDFHFICSIISESLSVNTKVILQDFTGGSSANVYSKLIPIFGKDNLFPNVLFDVTCGDGDCLVMFNDTDCHIVDNQFIQNKFIPLQMIKSMNSPFYNKLLKERSNIILNEISWKYIKLMESPESDFKFSHTIDYLFSVYNLPTNHNIHNIGELLNYMIRDIVLAQDCDIIIAEYIFANIKDRNNFISSFSIIATYD